jgi:hypothetical protein
MFQKTDRAYAGRMGLSAVARIARASARPLAWPQTIDGPPRRLSVTGHGQGRAVQGEANHLLTQHVVFLPRLSTLTEGDAVGPLEYPIAVWHRRGCLYVRRRDRGSRENRGLSLAIRLAPVGVGSHSTCGQEEGAWRQGQVLATDRGGCLGGPAASQRGSGGRTSSGAGLGGGLGR